MPWSWLTNRIDETTAGTARERAGLENTASIKEVEMKVPRGGQGVTYERKIECEKRLLVYAF